MKLKVARVGEGLHPSEIVISIETMEGEESLVVDQSLLSDDELIVGWPVGSNNDSFLVELPVETFRGMWRIWVPRTNVQLREVA